MSVEARTVQARPTGWVRAKWQEQYGEQRAEVVVDPARQARDAEFRVNLERRWGPQLGDNRNEGFRLNRDGAEALRDALTAALEWEAEK